MRCVSVLPRLLPAASVLFVALGCSGDSGPELGEVTGKVTLNGEPLADAQVEFTPEEGRPSTGYTDAEGKYTLQYTNEESGAVLGKHTVRITTGVAGFEGEGGEAGQEARPERVPPEYNSATELTREVKPGANEFNFELRSGGGTFSTGEGGAVPRDA